MLLTARGSTHLTYCTNIHPGESWAEVRQNLDRHLLTVRREIAPARPFGIGLRLSAMAAEELARPAALEEFLTFLHENQLYVFTINGFPYGPFHGRPVKEAVYLPDWMADERLVYTNRLADLLETLLPEQPAMDGTISTVPGAFALRVRSEHEIRTIARQMARHCAQLVRIRERSGKRLILALEPEPCCFLETVAETVDFFQHHLFGSTAVSELQQETGVASGQAEQMLREHLGVCFDVCHMAVEFEEPAAALRALDDAGIAVAKVQLSAGLRVEFSGENLRDRELLDALRAFADPVYLHQVVERNARGLRRFLDLPDALRAAEAVTGPREWRIHFHVPLFREQLGMFQSTQGYVGEVIDLLRTRPGAAHWEVETYTWDVLPEEHRGEEVASAVGRELRWVLDRAARKPHPSAM
jgi:sugar phosphate isomerase/epimerase